MAGRIRTLIALFAASYVAFAQQQPPPIAPVSAQAAVEKRVIAGISAGYVQIDGKWQFHLGDNLLWAQPSFNDSGWEKIDVDQTWGAQGHPSYAGFGWYRRHLSIHDAPGSNGTLRLLVPIAQDAYEVYWNGKLLGSYGRVPPRPLWYYNSFPRSFTLPGDLDGVLAIRVWKAPLYAFSSSDFGGLADVPIVGDANTIDLAEQSIYWDEIRGDLFDYSLVLLRTFIGALCIFLWYRNRTEPVFLWGGLFIVTPVALGLLQSLFLIPFTFQLGRFLNQPLYVLSSISLWYLLLYLLNHNNARGLAKATRIIAWIAFIAGLGDGLLALFWGSATLWMQWADGMFSLVILLCQAYPFVLIYLALRQKLDAPSWAVAGSAFLVQMFQTFADTSALGRRFTHWTLYSQLIDNPLFVIQGVAFKPEKLASLMLFAAIVFALYRYIVEQQQRRSVLEQQMEGAREIQKVLISDRLPEVNGYTLDSGYAPAHEVGGDFFQILPRSDGSTLIVIGDVSGKGLKAAMNVSMIVGVLRAKADEFLGPGEILSALNRCLVGRMSGGLATCMIFLFEPDGTVTLANAGHLAPFINGEDLEVEPALPLGIIESEVYPELKTRLQPGDTFHAYTDGLLEAHRSNVSELFGFERVKQLFRTRPTAQQVVQAAIDFGQEDDITILTLTRLPAANQAGIA